MGFLEKTEDEGKNKNFKVRPIKSSIYQKVQINERVNVFETYKYELLYRRHLKLKDQYMLHMHTIMIECL